MDGEALGLSIGAEEELLVDGVEPASSSLPQAAVAKSMETAEAARTIRRAVRFDMTVFLLLVGFQWGLLVLRTVLRGGSGPD
jgi:hypothetical protein